ncbi:hypothetical protein D1AOALGA4SA_10077 [Olavius algarvensis Delta 1 endosymbiont]|nr:hypothetical protein D1AOALGA4SA_10077 [Olavius algarvensis Delta 1 endosymbiont]
MENGSIRLFGGDKPRHYIVGQAKSIDISNFLQGINEFLSPEA